MLPLFFINIKKKLNLTFTHGDSLLLWQCAWPFFSCVSESIHVRASVCVFQLFYQCGEMYGHCSRVCVSVGVFRMESIIYAEERHFNLYELSLFLCFYVLFVTSRSQHEHQYRGCFHSRQAARFILLTRHIITVEHDMEALVRLRINLLHHNQPARNYIRDKKVSLKCYAGISE